MEITALTGLEPEWWTPPGQPETGDEVAFYIKPLTSIEYAMVMMYSVTDDEGIGVSERGFKNALKFGLIGWRNVRDQNGDPVEFSRLAVNTTHGLGIYYMALANKIITISEVGAAQKKT